jgi:hypothetical protein
MSVRKRPVFGIAALIVMLALILAEVLIAVFDPYPVPIPETDETFAVAIGVVAYIVLTLLVIGAVSGIAIISAGIGLLRGERRWPSVVALSLAIPELTIVVVTVSRL